MSYIIQTYHFRHAYILCVDVIQQYIIIWKAETILQSFSETSPRSRDLYIYICIQIIWWQAEKETAEYVYKYKIHVCRYFTICLYKYKYMYVHLYHIHILKYEGHLIEVINNVNIEMFCSYYIAHTYMQFMYKWNMFEGQTSNVPHKQYFKNAQMNPFKWDSISFLTFSCLKSPIEITDQLVTTESLF